MQRFDIILCITAGTLGAFLLNDLLALPLVLHIFLYLLGSLLCIGGFFLAERLATKSLVLFQGFKHILVGGAATVIDLKAFEFLVWVFSLVIAMNPLFAKGISFMISTSIKYVGNKFWTFQKHEKENLVQEISKFLFIMSIGVLIDVGVFYYLTRVLESPFSLTPMMWTKISVLIAAITAAIWNFLGDKFFVFKK
jgi:putative flippase GtrA